MSVNLFNKIKHIVNHFDGSGLTGATNAINELTKILLEDDMYSLKDKPLVNENTQGPSPTRTSSTGAVRSKLLGEQYRFDLLDSNGTAQRRLAAVYALGFKKYGPDNWKKGFPNSEYYAHAREHMINWINGVNSGEDDIAHAVWNLMAIMWNEENHPDMCDFPITGKTISKLANQQKG